MLLPQDLETLFQLAGLTFEAENHAQNESLRHDLNQIIAYVSQLSTVNTEDVVPTTHGAHVEPIAEEMLRTDEAHIPLNPDELLANAKYKSEGLIRVPQVIES